MLLCLLLITSAINLHGQVVSFTEKERDFISNHPTITFGGDKDWEPLIVMDNGNVSGFDRDMLDEIEKLTDLKFIIEAGNWAEVVKSANEFEIDGLTFSAEQPERRLNFLFSKPYLNFQLGFYALLREPKVNSLDDIRGRRVAVQASDQISNNFIDSLGYFQKKIYHNRQGVVEAILSHEVDFCFGSLDLDYYLAKNSITGIKLVHLVSGSGFEALYSIRKDYKELVSIINKSLDAIPDSRRNALMEKWGFERRSSFVIEKEILWELLGVIFIVLVIILSWTFSLIREIKKRKRVQLSLFESQAKLLAQVENSSGLIYSLDQELRVMVKNSNFEKFTKKINGRTIELGDVFTDQLPELFKEKWVERYRRGLNGEKYSVEDTTEITGELRSFITSLNPIKVNNKIVGVSCFTEDVTEHTALNRHMVQLLENSYDYIFIKDKDLKFVVASQSLAQINGLKSWHDFIGKTDFDIHPENAPEFHKDERRVIDEGLYAINKEHSFIDKSGRKRWVQSSNKPIYDNKGAITGLSGVSRDITEAKRSNQFNTMMLSAIDTTGDYIVFFDEELKFLYLNEAAKKFYGEENYLGKSIESLLATEVYESIKQNIEDRLDEGESWRDELKVIVPGTETKIIVDSVLVKVVDEDDQFICYGNVSRDISERSRLRQEVLDSKLREELQKVGLKAEERERKRIAYDLHDGVQQKLATATISLQSWGKEEAKEAIQLLNDSIAEIRTISHNLAPRALSSAGISAAIEDDIRHFNNVGKMRFEFYDNLEERRFDESVEVNFYRIFQEACTNIMKHSHATEVQVQLVLSDQILSLTIEDDGKGFELSQNSEDGLGLSNIQNRAKAIDGNIEIDSGFGRGTNILVEVKT